MPGYAAPPPNRPWCPARRSSPRCCVNSQTLHARGLIFDDLPDCAAAISADLSAIRDEFGLARSGDRRGVDGVGRVDQGGQPGGVRAVRNRDVPRHPEMLFEAQVRLAMSRILWGPRVLEWLRQVAKGHRTLRDPRSASSLRPQDQRLITASSLGLQGSRRLITASSLRPQGSRRLITASSLRPQGIKMWGHCFG